MLPSSWCILHIACQVLGRSPARLDARRGAEPQGIERWGARMLRLGRNIWITLECHTADCWVGVSWERKKASYRAGQGVVRV
jgi:hypothetical protein